MCCRLGQPSSVARHGFTLVEILVVLVILGIAAAMVVPRLSGMGDLQAISAARIVLADVEYAQDEAIVTQKPIKVKFATASSSYQLTDGEDVMLKHPLTKRAFEMKFPGTGGYEKVRILSANFSGSSTVEFDSLGAPDNGGAVRVDADGHTYDITVAAVTGKVSVTVVNP